MTILGFLSVAFAGGLGAVCRLLLDGIIQERNSGRFPWGTVTINVTGSFALGCVVGVAAGAPLPGSFAFVAGTGFLGGYTTFSTASYETVDLLREGRWCAGAANGLGVLVLAVLAAAAGFWITR
ncbi:chromosome condensation protein CrcB [Aeromicrobium sp. PE09-221]|uniref:fluoride efflux transporter CrcB n=1 Tax=Aeromicrobium sp. PE09-221 TaxID=1898043 RepID=UPI000B3E81A8|nr:fluoride efflux transporter CrcB [Aeromicrobium sp. PE09-221]OUZ10995.1 chromosome condensation protein CrcB [Aeromicrobium sp. PE09-221]